MLTKLYPTNHKIRLKQARHCQNDEITKQCKASKTIPAGLSVPDNAAL